MAMPQRDDTIEAIYLQGRVLFIKSAVFGIILCKKQSIKEKPFYGFR